MLAKLDFDAYLKTNLTGKTKTLSLDSITAKESQIIELLKDSENKNIPFKDGHQENLSLQSNKTDCSENDILESTHEKDNDSLSSILSEIDKTSKKNENRIFTHSPFTILLIFI